MLVLFIGPFFLSISLAAGAHAEPAPVDGQLRHALALAESGDAEAGWDVCEDLRSERTPVEDVAVTCAYLALETDRSVEALDLLDRAEDSGARSTAEWVQLRTRALRTMGAAALAARDAESTGERLSETTRDGLAADLAARQVIWGEIGTPDPERRFHDTEDALAALDALIGDPSVDGSIRLRARFDRLQALRDRRLFEEAVTVYESLRSQGVDVPAYALVAVADSALATRRPKMAVELYEDVVAAGDASAETRIGLYYAYLEAEELARAEGWITELADQVHPWRRRGRRTAPNWSKLRADVARALHFAFTDRPHEAQRQLEPLAKAAPMRAELHQELASVYRWRGWPRAARAKLAIALALEPTSVSARLGNVGAGFDLWQWREAEAELEELVALYPANAHVERLRQTAQLRHRWSFDLETSFGESDSDVSASGLGTRESATVAEIQTPALGAWRPYLRAERTTADLPEGDASTDRISLGLRAHRDGRWLRLEVHADDASTLRDIEAPEEFGWTVAAGAWLGDRWHLEARHESESRAVPLRARFHGIGGRRSEAAATFRASERFRTSLATAVSRYDDGNERREARLTLAGVPYTGPVYSLDLGLDLSASDNSVAGAPYFNPESDASTLLVAVQEWLGHRRYERRMVHRWAVEAGTYHQEGFGTSDVAVVRYEHDWRLGLASYLRYGLQWVTWVYDGQREERGNLFLHTGWHL